MLDYDFEQLAENHIEAWRSHYYGMTQQQVITELSVNYDWSAELEDNKVPDADVEEFEYEFTKAVLRQLGLTINEATKHKLEWCIENANNKIKDTLKEVYWNLVY